MKRFLALALFLASSAHADPAFYAYQRIQGDFPGIRIMAISKQDPKAAASVNALGAAIGLNMKPVLLALHSKAGDRTYHIWDGARNHYCIVTTDASYTDWKDAWNIDKGDQTGIAAQVDMEDVNLWLMRHEIYHCLENSQGTNHPNQVYNEAAADLFAALSHLAETGDKRLIEAVANIRRARVGLFNYRDTVHITYPALDAIVQAKTLTRASLRGLSYPQLASITDQLMKRGLGARAIAEAKRVKADPGLMYRIGDEGLTALRQMRSISYDPNPSIIP